MDARKGLPSTQGTKMSLDEIYLLDSMQSSNHELLALGKKHNCVDIFALRTFAPVCHTVVYMLLLYDDHEAHV